MKEAVQQALKNYANFKGRSTRPQYWWFYLFAIICSYAPILIASAVDMPMIATIGTIASLALLIPNLAAGVRRLHDVGKSGWFLLVPIYNLILLLSNTQPGENKWGPDPNNPDTFDFDNKTTLS
jgi:uncharacterized membrane protein YhaH (DUF805 family)